MTGLPDRTCTVRAIGCQVADSTTPNLLKMLRQIAEKCHLTIEKVGQNPGQVGVLHFYAALADAHLTMTFWVGMREAVLQLNSQHRINVNSFRLAVRSTLQPVRLEEK